MLIAHISGLAGAICFKELLPWGNLQRIWFDLGWRSQSYIGAKMKFSFFLSVYSRCGMPASWTAQHLNSIKQCGAENASFSTVFK